MAVFLAGPDSIPPRGLCVHLFLTNLYSGFADGKIKNRFCV